MRGFGARRYGSPFVSLWIASSSLESLEHLAEPFPHLRVQRPFHILPVACMSWDDVEVQVEDILLGLWPGTVEDLDVLDPESLAVEVHNVLKG